MNGRAKFCAFGLGGLEGRRRPPWAGGSLQARFFLGGGVGKNGGEGNINNHWAILAVSPPPYPAPQPEPQRGTNAEMAHRWLGGWLAGWEQVFINLNPASLAGPLQG